MSSLFHGSRSCQFTAPLSILLPVVSGLRLYQRIMDVDSLKSALTSSCGLAPAILRVCLFMLGILLVERRLSLDIPAVGAEPLNPRFFLFRNLHLTAFQESPSYAQALCRDLLEGRPLVTGSQT